METGRDDECSCMLVRRWWKVHASTSPNPCIAANRNRHTNYLIKHLVIDLEAMFGDSWLYWKGQGPRNSLPPNFGPDDGHCGEPLFVQYAVRRGAHYGFALEHASKYMIAGRLLRTPDDQDHL